MHFATILEGISDRLGERDALVHGSLRRSWREYEQRAARLAGAFTEAGLAPGAKVGQYLYNGPEYLETGLAALKQRMTPVNVNYRYVDAELEYLLENSDCEALVFDAALAETVARVAPRLPGLRLCLQVGEGSPAPGAADYEEVLAASAPSPRCKRKPDDLFMMYTGGTTGMPKGVMYDLADFTAGVGNMMPLVLFGRQPVATDAEAIAYAQELDTEGKAPVFLPCSPLMHTAGLFQAMGAQLLGGRIVTLPERAFDPHAIWRAVSEEGVTAMVLVGDAFARPLLDALQETNASGQRYELSALRHIISSGVAWSSEVKQGLLECGDFVLVDGIGATEGAMGVQISQRGAAASETARFLRLADTKVFSEDGREIEAGSDEVGLIAAGGILVPKGYYKDAEKSARTFRKIGGKRYAFIGDWGRIDADGTLVFLGRGSGCINTAGEKVFPEEVESFLKTHPEVEDCLVVGVADERFGERVAAVVAARSPDRDLEAELLGWGKDELAGYKRPRLIAQVERIPRAPNGKPDYKWARKVATEHAGRAQ
ncbi:MAG: AMP-binding protein [Myxococcota bacterium]